MKLEADMIHKLLKSLFTLDVRFSKSNGFSNSFS